MFDILLSPECGACAAGIAEIGETPTPVVNDYIQWLDRDFAADMAYMARHLPIRTDPGLLLDQAKSIISLAFPYPDGSKRPENLPRIASYAQGSDYHDVLRSRLSGITERLRHIYGGEYRICIDSAPIFERFWAQRCGIGTRCDNGLIAVPGYGTRVFLAEILTTIPPASLPFPLPAAHIIGETSLPVDGFPTECTHCGACRRACPAGALQPDSSVDARRCLSYLTIEHRGPWNPIGETAMSTPAGRRTLFGCDICQNVCPLNRSLPNPNNSYPDSNIPLPDTNSSLPDTNSSFPNPNLTHVSPLPEFLPRPEILTLTIPDILALTPESFSRLFRGSPIKRTKLAGLLRNALHCQP